MILYSTNSSNPQWIQEQIEDQPDILPQMTLEALIQHSVQRLPVKDPVLDVPTQPCCTKVSQTMCK